MDLPLRVSASILASDFARLGEQIAQVEKACADWIHVDVMDGVFVPNISFGLPIIDSARRSTSLPVDVHLMIVQPESHIQAVVDAGADIVTVHVEVCPHLHRVVQQIRQAGARPAVALNPHTPLGMIEEILPFVEMVLLLTVNPGHGGQQFMPEMLDKIRRLRAMADSRNLPLEIQVDGGINPATAAQVIAHGANVLVAGTSVFRCPDGLAAGITALKQAAEPQGVAR